MIVRFWGVRGSVPTPGPYSVKYGGNTACIEVRGDKGELLIVDAGTGLRELGNSLLANNLNNDALNISILLTHTHWDHIQGFPFFSPAFIPSTKITFLGPVSAVGKTLQEIVAGQMSYSYFPINLKELRGTIEFKELQGDQSLEIGPFNITTCYLNHPILCLGYRINYGDKTVVTLYDSEPYRNIFLSDKEEDEANKGNKDGGGSADTAEDADDIFSDEFDIDADMVEDAFAEAEECVRMQNQKIIDFAMNSDFLIHDAQYTQEEYKTKLGWGHSSMEYALDSALKTNCKKMALFHHDPMRTDDQLDELAEGLSKRIKSQNPTKDVKVFFARERLEVEI